MSTSFSQHHVTGITVDASVHAIRITAIVGTTNFETMELVPSILEIDLYAQHLHDAGAPARLELLKQLSEAATAAYEAERNRLHAEVQS